MVQPCIPVTSTDCRSLSSGGGDGVKVMVPDASLSSCGVDGGLGGTQRSPPRSRSEYLSRRVSPTAELRRPSGEPVSLSDSWIGSKNPVEKKKG